MTDYLYLPGGENGDFLETPDSVALSVTGDIDLRMYAALEDWTPTATRTLFAKFAGSNQSYAFYALSSGRLRFNWSEDGTTTEPDQISALHGLADRDRQWLRVTLDVDNGAGDAEIKFYLGGSDLDNPVWVQLGATLFHGSTTSIADTGATLRVGTNGFGTGETIAEVYRVQARDGIEGTLVFDADLTALTVADLEAGTFTESSSEAATVTLNGDAWTYARIYTVHDILRETEALYMAGDGNKFHSPKWADRSGHNHHAQNGSAAGADSNDALGKTHDGFQYLHIPAVDGNNLQDATPPASADIAVEDVATVAIWFRTPGFRTFDRIFATRAGNEGFMIALGSTSASDAECSLDDGPTSLGLGPEAHGFAVDVWNHYVLTIDHTTAVDIATQYFNGVAGSTTLDISTLGTIAASASGMAIGAEANGSNPFRGDIATVEFYKELATASQITAAHAGGVGTQLPLGAPVAVVNMDDLTEPFATFTDPQSNVWTYNRSSSGLVLTVIDQDQWLHSTDDYHQVPDAPGLNFAADESFTVIGVGRVTDATPSGFHELVGKRRTTEAGYALEQVGAGTTISGSIWGTSGSANDQVGPLADNTLFSVTARRDVTADEIETFLDAMSSGSPAMDGTTGGLTNVRDLLIGSRPEATPDTPWEGSIMAVAIWRRALTDAEILDAHQLLTGQALVKDNYLHFDGATGEFADSPDAAPLDITGDIDIRIRVAFDDWTPAATAEFAGKWQVAGELSYAVALSTAGLLRIFWSADGTASLNRSASVATGFADGSVHWVRFTLDVDNGSGDTEGKFYAADGALENPVAADFTQIGLTHTLTGTTSIHSGTSTVKLGSWSTSFGSMFGNVYRFQVRDGIDGTLVLDEDFIDLTVTELEAGTFVENLGATVTFNGDEWAYVRPYDRDDLLATSELLLQAHDGNKGFSPKWADRSRRNHHAQLGSGPGPDSADPLFKAYDNVQYVFLPGTTGNWMSLPDIAAYDLTTQDFDLRVRLAATDWTPAGNKRIVAKFETSPTNGYKLNLTSGGDLEYITDNAGTFEILTSSVPVPFTDGDVGWIRVALVGTTLTFYTSTDTTDDPDDVVWTQLGVTRTTTQDPATGDNDFYIGRAGSGDTNQWAGAIYRVWFDIGGTVELDVVLEDAAQPYATFTERSANAATVTINRSSSGLVTTVVDRDTWLYTTDDYHQIVDHPDLDFGLNDSLTIVGAFRFDENDTNWRLLVHKASGSGANLPQYSMSIRGTVAPAGGIRFRVADGTLNSTVDGLTLLDDMHLHSSIGVRNVADDDLELFIDGASDAAPETDDVTASLENTGLLRIGSLAAGIDFWEGEIVAVALWRRALTDAEVAEVHPLLTRHVFAMEATADGTITNVEDELDLTTDIYQSIDDPIFAPDDTDWINNAIRLPPRDVLDDTELLLQARNYDGTEKWLDESGNGHDAQFGSSSGTDTNDPFFKAYGGEQYVFHPGSAGNYLSSARLAITGDIDLRWRGSLPDWTPAAGVKFITQWTSGQEWLFGIVTDGKIELGIDVTGGSSFPKSTVATGLADNEIAWIRVTRANTELKFYTADGALTNPSASDFTQLGTTVTSTAGTFDNTSNNLNVGAFNDGSSPHLGGTWRAQVYDGIDGTLEYDAVLADATTPFATFTERSLNAAIVTINRSSSGLVMTVVDQDMFLYTTDDYHLVADDPGLNFGTGDSWTAMVVARLVDGTPGTNQTLVSKIGATGSTPGWQLQISTASGIQATIFDGSGSTTDAHSFPVDNTLFTAAGVRNVTDDDLEVFDDAVGSGSPTTDTTTASLSSTTPVQIGARQTERFLEGQIMAIAVWRRALTDAEVLEAHNALTGSVVEYFPLLTDVPPAFGNAETAHIVVRYAGVNVIGETLNLHAQIFEGDEVTALSDEVLVATVTEDSPFDDTVSIPFTGLDTGKGKSVWDEARLRLRWN